jgi:hypothetical protein
LLMSIFKGDDDGVLVIRSASRQAQNHQRESHQNEIAHVPTPSQYADAQQVLFMIRKINTSGSGQF